MESSCGPVSQRLQSSASCCKHLLQLHCFQYLMMRGTASGDPGAVLGEVLVRLHHAKLQFTTYTLHF